MIYTCCNEKRKAAILGHANLNGIDYLEVLDHDAIALNSPRQQTLVVHCLNPAPSSLTPANVIIQGGESVTEIAIEWVALASTPPTLANSLEQRYFAGLSDAANVLVVRTDKAGDFSTYKLRLVNDAAQAQQDPFNVTEAVPTFDPLLAEIEFSFRVECGTDFDCCPQPPGCPPPSVTQPFINYLAKDYGSFRTVMLDRMNQLLPNWGATSEADLGIALAEIISYVCDHLSYQQDAIATEAYLRTARSRISLRRHALLVDYRVHDGCNARVWMQLKVEAQVLMDRNHAYFATHASGMPAVLANNETAAFFAGSKLFQPMQNALLFPEHNQMSFYTWGDTDCCLPSGSTEATLAGTFPNLQPGDVLIFQEAKGPQTGLPADADMRHRCAVRLTQVATSDSRGEVLRDPLFGQAVTQIQWSAGDALPFAVCLSSAFIDSTGARQNVSDVSIVLGNVVLADHGYWFSNVNLGTVPAPRLFYAAGPAPERCSLATPTPVPVRFRCAIPDSPITQAVPLPLAGSPVTPAVVMLSVTSAVSLTDSNGIVTLLIQPADLFKWPQNFGVVVTANAANFDLAVIYNAATPVVVERLLNLSLKPADPNYAPTQINRFSRFISVPASYTPATAPLSGFPAGPTLLSDSGTVDLKDTHALAFLTVQATNPASWAPLFGVLAQGNQLDPDVFNLVVIYKPPSGGVGVNPPVIVEEFNNVSRANVGERFDSVSELISVRSFADAPNASLSASDLMAFDPASAVPVISLQEQSSGTRWTARQDLLEEEATSPTFVVEVESNGSAGLRFGDDINGRKPAVNMSFVAQYRIGSGTAGNVGAESLVYCAVDAPGVVSCINPLPASGGVDPETNDQIRRRAPQAFQTQERALTLPDYESVAESNPQVNQAVATLRWTGSWHTVFIAAEPRGGGNLMPKLKQQLKKNIEQYRLAGQDLQLESPQYVSLEIELKVSVDPNYFRSDVKRSLLAILGDGILPNGRKGLFYPDSFTFGQTVYLSPLYAAARSQPGVLSVTATKFQPQGINSTRYLTAGEIKLGAFQVARLENDPSFPDHGQLTLVMVGGK